MNDQSTIIRWKAIIYYRSKTGTVDVEHRLEELSDLQELVELGPHWDTIAKIEVFRVNHTDAADLTVEDAKVMEHMPVVLSRH